MIRDKDYRSHLLAGVTVAGLLFALTSGATAQTADTTSSTTVTQTIVSGPAIAPPMQVNYAILGDPKLDYFSIRRAQAYGLTMDQISDAYALAHETLQTLPQVLDQVEDGATFASLAVQWGVPMEDVYSPEKYRDRINDYLTAYQCTGTGALHNENWHPADETPMPALLDNSTINGTGVSGTVNMPAAPISASSTSVTTTTTTPAIPVVPATSATATSGQAITDVIHSDGRFTQLSSAITAAGLDAYLRNNGPFTLFAPTDAAFAKLPPSELTALLQNPTQLSKVLQYHVVGQNMDQTSLMSLTSPSVTSIEGSTLNITTAAGATTVNGANVLQAGIPASNGTIYPIDTVLVPSDQTLTGSALSPASSDATSSTTTTVTTPQSADSTTSGAMAPSSSSSTTTTTTSHAPSSGDSTTNSTTTTTTSPSQ